MFALFFVYEIPGVCPGDTASLCEHVYIICENLFPLVPAQSLALYTNVHYTDKKGKARFRPLGGMPALVQDYSVHFREVYVDSHELWDSQSSGIRSSTF
jgi:hypothetical protein